MARFRVVTLDAYTGLSDLASSLLPVVTHLLTLERDIAGPFLRHWRAKQIEGAALSNVLGGERISFHRCTELALDDAAAHFNLNIDAALRTQLVQAWYPLKPWPEAVEVLDALRERGVTVAILSNGDRAMLEAIANQVPGRIDHVFSTEDAGVYKPAPQVYDLPFASLDIGRDEVLHVAGGRGDVIGARAAGLSCYWNNRNGDRVLFPEFSADYEFADLRGLLDVPGLG